MTFGFLSPKHRPYRVIRRALSTLGVDALTYSPFLQLRDEAVSFLFNLIALASILMLAPPS